MGFTKLFNAFLYLNHLSFWVCIFALVLYRIIDLIWVFSLSLFVEELIGIHWLVGWGQLLGMLAIWKLLVPRIIFMFMLLMARASYLGLILKVSFSFSKKKKKTSREFFSEHFVGKFLRCKKKKEINSVDELCLFNNLVNYHFGWNISYFDRGLNIW